jgi:type IV pilus assembly protein PilA
MGLPGGRITVRTRNGFTLIEMMTVVVIVGVLSVLAIYGVRKYISDSKTAEANNQLGVIAKDAAEAYTKEGYSSTTGSVAIGIAGSTGYNPSSAQRAMCPTTTKVPSTPPPAKKYQSAPGEWSGNAGWQCLKFQIQEPQYFSYQYVLSNSTLYTATANGDLNGDTVPSTFSVVGSVMNGAMNTSVTIQQTDPEE